MKKENAVVKNDVILNSFQALPRLPFPVYLRNNMSGRWQIKSALTADGIATTTKRKTPRGFTPFYPPELDLGVRRLAKGFTLIELLVVVLIIGILAAVAVPQYQFAVLKSRSVQALTVIKALEQGIDNYVLENGFSAVFFTGNGKNADLIIDVKGLTPTTYSLERLGKFVYGISPYEVYSYGHYGYTIYAFYLPSSDNTSTTNMDNDYYCISRTLDFGTGTKSWNCTVNNETKNKLGKKFCDSFLKSMN